MTLRGRLTTAFLVVVLGPVLLGAFFVGNILTTVSHDRAVDRLNLAAATVRATLGAICQQLRAAAQAVALAPDPGNRSAVADALVTRGLASAIVVTDATGATAFQVPAAPPLPWGDCDRTAQSDPPRALAVRAEIRDPAGAAVGAVTAAQILDADFVARLADVTGVEVTLLRDGHIPAVAYSTEPQRARDGVVTAAAGLRGSGVAQNDDRYVRRVDPSPGQPLPLVLSVQRDRPPGDNALLVAAVVVAGVVGVFTAWRLARMTTRPLAELAEAAERVGRGDLTARVPIRGHDEVGQLASAFNRMTREIQAYVHALTASRDQLRGHVAILGDTLSSTHDLERILKLILRTALAATSARAGVVSLLDAATGTLVGRAAEGIDELEPPGEWPVAARDQGRSTLRVPLGSGVLGTVAATGRPLRGRVDRDRPEPAAGEPRCRTYIAVPVSVPSRRAEVGGGPEESRPTDARADPLTTPPALGVLAVYDRLGADEFDEGDLVTLRTFAGQAAVAVDNVRMHDEAQRLSLTDPLTNLWNYRHLKMSLDREIERAGRTGRRLTVLALDLDRFKEVNDTYGHAAGDEVLVEFARRIRAVVREVDLAFRKGGEEFVVLLPETDARGGTIVAERLGAAVRDTPITVRSHAGADSEAAGEMAVSVTVSIGIAVYPDHAIGGQQLLDAADEALYAAKAAGRDCYRLATRPKGQLAAELAVPLGAASPDGPLPVAGRLSSGATGVADGSGGGAAGASSAAQPPRQSRGR